MDKINLSEKLAAFTDTWSPKIVGELNGQYVKLAKLEGEFIWHRHDEEDELFVVLGGRMTLHTREESITLEKGELLVVPRGVEHKPVGEPMAQVLHVSSVSTRNTGNVENERTVADPEWI